MSATGGHRDQCGVPLGSFWKEVIWLTFASAPRRVEASSQGFSVTSTGGRPELMAHTHIMHDTDTGQNELSRPAIANLNPDIETAQRWESVRQCAPEGQSQRPLEAV